MADGRGPPLQRRIPRHLPGLFVQQPPDSWRSKLPSTWELSVSWQRGRNRVVLETLKELGADALVPLDQEHTSLVAAIRRESAQARIDVVLDYLWGAPAKAVLEATWGKGLERAPSRTRFVQVGESGGPSISLPAAILRSSGIELMGSGFVSASMEELFKALAEFLLLAAKSSPRINIKSVPLKTWKASGPLLKKARA